MNKKEVWKSIPGYDGQYDVSNVGRVRSYYRTEGRPHKVLKTFLHPLGYMILRLFKDGEYKNWRVHQLVALAFLPNPDNKKIVNHKNGVKHDNKVDNLEWVTKHEDIQHAYDIGLHKPCWLGKKFSKEHKQKISDSMKRYWKNKRENNL